MFFDQQFRSNNINYLFWGRGKYNIFIVSIINTVFIFLQPFVYAFICSRVHASHLNKPGLTFNQLVVIVKSQKSINGLQLIGNVFGPINF